MPHNRYYIDAALETETVFLTGDEGHHLVRVMRAREGDLVELVNGRGKLAKASVHRLSKQGAELIIEEIIQESPPPSPLILAMAIPRMNHLEWVIEKATELGATEFWLFPGLRSEKQTLNTSQHTRLKALCLAAMKQCGRVDLPPIKIYPPLLKWEPIEGTLFFGDTSTQAPYLWNLGDPTPPPSPILFFIGPEKGFDNQERVFLIEKLRARGIKLHSNILRTETAAITAMAQIQLLIK